MKKTGILLFIITLFSTVQAQESLIKVSPFHFFNATFNMSFEKKITSDKSINLSGGFHLRDRDYISYGEGDAVGWTGEFQLRKYLVKYNSDLSGIFVAPFFKGSYFDITYNDDIWYVTEESYYDADGIWYPQEGEYIMETSNDEIKSVQGGVLMGVQYVIKDVISLEFYLGGGIQYSEVEGNSEDNWRYDSSLGRGYNGVIPKIGFNVGAAF